eukprot:jgi/Chlat1/7851/Chrsp66S00578
MHMGSTTAGDVWGGGRALAEHIAAEVPCDGKVVLELGAGVGLPSLAAAAKGAAKLFLTDYPDATTLAALRTNVGLNFGHDDNRFVVAAHEWGSELTGTAELDEAAGSCDVVLMADIVYDERAHGAVLASCCKALAPAGTAFCAVSLECQPAEYVTRFVRMAEQAFGLVSCSQQQQQQRQQREQCQEFQYQTALYNFRWQMS